MLYREIIEVETKKGIDCMDITKHVSDIAAKSMVHSGMCSVFLAATTAGLMLNEHELMLIEDFKRFFRQVDESRLYNHPSNAFSHIRAGMLRAGVTIPVEGSRLMLGRWQSILLWEFDIEPRKRKVVVTVYDSHEHKKKAA